MCQAKPDGRCKADATKAVEDLTEQYRSALNAHATDVDNARAVTRLEKAAGALWVAKLEQAGATGGAGQSSRWWNHVGAALVRTHAEQVALMPARPDKGAPAEVRKAYQRLADLRDEQARVDAVAIADECTPLSATAPPGPAMGARPLDRDIENKVAAAELEYTALLHPDARGTEGERWRRLITHGQVPYDPFANPEHPHLSDSAPWMRHHHPAHPADVPTLRRATGMGDDVYFDTTTNTITVHCDAEEWLDAEERDDLAARTEHALWQLGYHTERRGALIAVGRTPDLPAWRASLASRSTQRTVSAA